MRDLHLLAQTLFSDLLMVTVFQSLNPFSQKSNDECVEMAEKKELTQEQKTKWEIFYLITWRMAKGFQFFLVKSTCSNKSISLQRPILTCTEVQRISPSFMFTGALIWALSGFPNSLLGLGRSGGHGGSGPMPMDKTDLSGCGTSSPLPSCHVQWSHNCSGWGSK